MIYSLRGKLIFTERNTAVIECAGVGYKCNISLKTYEKLPKLNDEAFLYTYMAVKEDSVDLFGFVSVAEVEAFKLLISVSGVGPKVAVAILSEFNADRIMLLIASGDFKALTAASGVGNKVAQRIVLELKDKIGNIGIAAGNEEITSAGTNSNEAVSALVALGFSQSDAARAVGKYNAQLKTEDLIKQALKDLSRQV